MNAVLVYLIVLDDMQIYNSLYTVKLNVEIPQASDVAPSCSAKRFSELSAVPIEASDSSSSSSDVRGSNANISNVSSSL